MIVCTVIAIVLLLFAAYVLVKRFNVKNIFDNQESNANNKNNDTYVPPKDVTNNVKGDIQLQESDRVY